MTDLIKNKNLPLVKKFAAGCCTAGAGAELKMSANGFPKPRRSSDALLGATAAACPSDAPKKSTIFVFAAAAGGEDKKGFVAAVGDDTFCCQGKGKPLSINFQQTHISKEHFTLY